MNKKESFEIAINKSDTSDNSTIKKNFNWKSLLGIAFSLTNSWLGISASLATGISSGGPVLIIYGLIIGFVFSLMYAYTLSNFAKLLPNSNGPSYWVLRLCERNSDLSSDKSTLVSNEEDTLDDDSLVKAKYTVENLESITTFQRSIGLVTGLLNYFGSVFTTASVCSSLSLNILGMYAATHPGYELQKWHTFVTFQCLNILVLLGNIWSKPLPSILRTGLYLSILTFFLTFLISLVSRSENVRDPWPSSSSIFVQFDNNTGWKSSGIAFIVGLINPFWAFVGIDSATHMTDEVGHSKARTIVPQVIYTTVILGFVTSFVYSITMFYCITDKESVQSSILPILEIYQQATKNRNLSLLMQSMCTSCGIISGVASSTWQSRILWSISRDYSSIDRRLGKNLTAKFFSWIANIDPVLETPLRSVLLSHFFVIIIGCIFMGSTTAFNAIITASITLLFITYAIPSVILIIKSSFKSFKTESQTSTETEDDVVSSNTLNWVQYLIHFLCVMWALFCLCFFSLPYELPVTASSMNYVSVAYAAVALGILIFVHL